MRKNSKKLPKLFHDSFAEKFFKQKLPECPFKLDVHAKHVCKNLSQISSIFCYLRRYICQKTLLMLYYSLVNSHILNEILVWGSTNQTIQYCSNCKSFKMNLYVEQVFSTKSIFCSKLERPAFLQEFWIQGVSFVFLI